MKRPSFSLLQAAMTLATALFLANSAQAQGCTYVLKMFDEGGDGWEGSYVSVQINGGPWTQYTCAEGYAEAELPVQIGDVVLLTYTAGSSMESEIGFGLEMAGQDPWNSVVHGSAWGPTGGYAFTANCIPPYPLNSDCLGSIQHSWSFPPVQIYNQFFNVYRTGNVDDLGPDDQGCLSNGEVHGIWVMLSSESPNGVPQGALDLTIAPGPQGSGNYDFALWGPFDVGQWGMCDDLGEPVRCSRATTIGTTGLSSAALDEVEDETGDGWLAPVWMGAETYYLLYVTDAIPSLGFGFTFDAFTLSTNANELPMQDDALTVFPNPSIGPVEIILPSVPANGARIFLFDATGRMVRSMKVANRITMQRVAINVEGLAPAAYTVQLVAEDGTPLAQGRLIRQ